MDDVVRSRAPHHCTDRLQRVCAPVSIVAILILILIFILIIISVSEGL